MPRLSVIILSFMIVLSACGAPAAPAADFTQPAAAATSAPQAAAPTETAVDTATAAPTSTPAPVGLGPDNFAQLSQLHDYAPDLQELAGEGQEYGVGAPVFSPDGRHFATRLFVGDHPSLIVLDVESGDLLGSIKLDKSVSDVSNPVFTPDGQKLISGTYPDGKLIVWDIASQKVERTLWSKKNSVLTDFTISPDGKQITAVVTDTRTSQGAADLMVWDFASGKLLKQLPVFVKGVRISRPSADGRRLIVTTAGDGKELTVYDTSTWDKVAKFRPPTGASTAALSPDGALAVTVNGFKEHAEILVWDTASGEQVNKLQNQLAGTDALEFSPDGRMLLVSGTSPFAPGTDSGFIRGSAWDTGTWTQVGRLYWSELDILRFALDGKSLLAHQAGSLLRLGLPDNDLLEKRGELLKFTDALAAGDYAAAGALMYFYSGEQDDLKKQGLPTEPAAILEAICTRQALPCLPATVIYSARQTVDRAGLSDYLLLVQYTRPDGTLFATAEGASIFQLNLQQDADGAFKVLLLDGWAHTLTK